MAEREVTAQAALYQCKSCERKIGADGFYPSNQSRCKECVKLSVRKNRAEKIDYYRLYDRQRYRNDPVRQEQARKCAASDAGVAARKRHADRGRSSPERLARIAVGNAVRDGKITKGEACFFCGCGGKLHAHHHDYSKPLDVFWLCPACHGKLHTVNGDFLKENRT